MNQMRKIKVEKVTLNIGAGKDQHLLEKGEKLLKNLSGITPVKTITNKRIQGWGLRPGLPIGVKLTLRGDSAIVMLKRLLAAKDNELTPSTFDNNGNVSFGIPEYVDIAEAKYDPAIGIIGLQTSITLSRPGFRVAKRRLLKNKLPLRHRISKEEAMNYFKENFNVKVGENQ